MKRKITKGFLILSILILTSSISFSQDTTKITPSIQLQYFKYNNDSSLLRATLTYSKNRMEIPLPGMKVALFSGTGNKIPLAEIATDNKGAAVFNLVKKSDFSPDQNGLWPFGASFTGNDSVLAGSAEILIRDITLSMEMNQGDSIKTISLRAEKIEKGKYVPVSGESITVYVPRMFSQLPIGDATFDETGIASVEFPADLPGDKEGNVTVIARFEDHPEFGNVITQKTLKWGVPATSISHSSHRALWTKTAPKWMIYTLSILLTGVWGHYLFAIISLIRIRINAKRIQEEEDYGK